VNDAEAIPGVLTRKYRQAVKQSLCIALHGPHKLEARNKQILNFELIRNHEMRACSSSCSENFPETSDEVKTVVKRKAAENWRGSTGGAACSAEVAKKRQPRFPVMSLPIRAVAFVYAWR